MVDLLLGYPGAASMATSVSFSSGRFVVALDRKEEEAEGRGDGGGAREEKRRLGFGGGEREAAGLFYRQRSWGCVAWWRRQRACEGDSDRCVSVRGRRRQCMLTGQREKVGRRWAVRGEKERERRGEAGLGPVS